MKRFSFSAPVGSLGVPQEGQKYVRRGDRRGTSRTQTGGCLAGGVFATVQEGVPLVRRAQHAHYLVHQRRIAAARGLEPCAPARGGLLECRVEERAHASELFRCRRATADRAWESRLSGDTHVPAV